MRPSRVKAKLRRREPVLMTAMHFFDPSVYEMTSLMGFDGIWMDLEHHGTSLETAMNLMRAARVGASDIMVRPAKWEYMRFGRMLEAGAQGIMYPRCSTADEAREVVSWAKFAPLGRRGFDGGNADAPYCAISSIPDYIKQANEETFVVVQIEDGEALSQVDAIAAVEGVDVLFFGPSDFSILSGFPGQFDHPLLDEALVKIAAAAKKHGKAWGMPAFNLEWAKRLMGLGATFLAHGCDIVFVKNGLEAIQRDWKSLGFTFDRRLP
jgi:4-hydroxy-2-oxoheptanedioate aldolase